MNSQIEEMELVHLFWSYYSWLYQLDLLVTGWFALLGWF